MKFPGVIDTHVHFREPGLTHKATIYTESRAAQAGGVTLFLDMPNTKPTTTTWEAWEEKMQIAQRDSAIGYGFFIGATNDNWDVVREARKHGAPGIKVFMGSSTGNMLVDREEMLDQLFREADVPIAVHAEDEGIIRANLAKYKQIYGDTLPPEVHPLVRSREACVRATEHALELALRYGTRLHICHVSTKDELELIREARREEEQLLSKHPELYRRYTIDYPRLITAETCPHYLIFSDEDYARLGNRIKCNPAIKTADDREALWEAIWDGTIDTIGTDHAPHLLEEKEQGMGGMPGVQFSLPLMLTLFENHRDPSHAFGMTGGDVCGMTGGDVIPTKERSNRMLPIERIANLMSYNPAHIFGLPAQPMIDIEKCSWTIRQEDVLSKCGWTPYEGMECIYKVSTEIPHCVRDDRGRCHPDEGGI